MAKPWSSGGGCRVISHASLKLDGMGARSRWSIGGGTIGELRCDDGTGLGTMLTLTWACAP